MMDSVVRSRLIGFVVGGVILFTGDLAAAQVIPDQTLGNENSTVRNDRIRGRDGIDRDSDLIEGGARRANNLFHSFERFDIPEGRAAYFANPDGVRNIFSRITGNDRSEIFGTLGVLGDADLFFMNPNGILFGQNARLDVGGSFVGTTANSIGFGNLGFFSATNPEVPSQLLTIDPSALVFSSQAANSGQISVQGDGKGTRTTTELIDTQSGLHVPDDSTLALAGGNLFFDGATLKTAGGWFELGSVASPAIVTLNPVADGWSLDYTGVQNFGDIQLSQQSTVDASGLGGGNIRVYGRRIALTGGSQIEASTLGNESGKALEVFGSESVELNGSGEDFITGLISDAYQGATGSAGNITVTTGQLEANGNKVQISSSTAGQGGSGNLRINTGTLSLQNGAQILTSTYGAGDAGDMTIRASGTINLRGSNADNSTGLFAGAITGATGTGGNLTIRARNVIVRNGAGINLDTYGIGDAGDLTIRAKNVIIRGSQVSTSTDGEGNAGDMTIRASNLVELSGEERRTRNGVGSPGGLLAQVDALTATGRGGNLTINTRRLEISDGSKVQVATFGPGDAGVLRIQADEIDIFDTPRPNLYSTGIIAGVGNDPIGNRETKASGDGGRLIIDANRLSIHGGEVSSDTRGIGDAGTARIRSRDLIEVIDPVAESGRRSFLSARVLEGARGNAGDLIIDTEQLVIRGGQVSVSSSGTGRAGNLVVRVPGSIELSGVSSRRVQTNAVDGRIILPEQPASLSAQVDRSGRGPGGNLTIQTNQLTVNDRAQVSVSNQGSARAGNLSIKAGSIELTDHARISAETRSDNGGNILMTADTVRLRGDSDIQTRVDRGRGAGGDITITADSILAFDDSDIISSAPNQGGDINLNTPAFFGTDYQPDAAGGPDGNDRVDLDATGTVSSGNVTTPDTSFIQNSLIDLPDNSINTDQLLANSCIVRTRNQPQGQFIITGADGLPDRPGSITLPDFPTGEIRNIPDGTEVNDQPWQLGDPIVEPQGVYRLPDGRLVMSRECEL